MAKKALEPPDLTTVGGRLRWAREAMGYSSARAAANYYGWNENTYKSHEVGMRGSEGLKTATGKKYARAFHVSVEWLMAGVGGPNLKRKSQAEQQWDEMSDEERRLALQLLSVAKGT